MKWFSDSIKMVYWGYIMQMSDGNSSGAPGSNWTLRAGKACMPEAVFPEAYERDERLMARNGYCGFKI